MAHKKGMGSSRNGRDSNAQRMGIKAFGGQQVTSGSIIVRQKGTLYHPGAGVGLGSDYTIFAKIDGVVKFETCHRSHSSGKKISVYAAEPAAEAVEAVA